MLNPVQGVRNFANNHPKATKVAKVAVGVGAAAAVAAGIAGVATGKIQPKKLDTTAVKAFFGKAGEKATATAETVKKGLGSIGQKLAEVPAKVSAFFSKTSETAEKVVEEVAEQV